MEEVLLCRRRVDPLALWSTPGSARKKKTCAISSVMFVFERERVMCV